MKSLSKAMMMGRCKKICMIWHLSLGWDSPVLHIICHTGCIIDIDDKERNSFGLCMYKYEHASYSLYNLNHLTWC